MSKAANKANERVIFNGPVRAQRGDIYKVVSMGVTTEFTDRISEAEEAYKDAVKPKAMFKISRGTGTVQKMREQVI